MSTCLAVPTIIASRKDNGCPATHGAVRGGAAIVFAAGNDGWNSETGRHKIYSRSLYDPDGSHRNWVDYRHEEELDTIKTRARRINVGVPVGR